MSLLISCTECYCSSQV